MKLQAHHIRALKGKRQLIQINVTGPEMAEAAEAAGIDIVVTGRQDQRAAVRTAAPDTHFCFSLRHGDLVTQADVLRAGFDALNAGADSVYCSLSPRFIEVLAREGIPVCAHAGLVPQRARLTGMRGFGKSATEAIAIFDAVRAFEQAGAAMVELELVAAPIAAMISRSTALCTVSIGSGASCDVQYLFGSDILGEPGRKPRHARVWDDFSTEYSRLQDRRKAAFAAFRAEALAGTFPANTETVAAPPDEIARFGDWLAGQTQSFSQVDYHET